ncbi:GNAT family N-acetyltransferase [Streptomyces sp. EN27]|uniref:GNAT family N-acetyltransferase n=1 Tax=Streptomyces sp. EN27 TaxID=211464 RepID=UPI00085198C2|nr:GNAT family N-acetyltransferase [Streptomyces sp. EN27]
MEIAEQDGVVVATVDRAEAERQAWKSAGAPVDIVRLAEPDSLDESALAGLGFVTRPRWINWCAPVKESAAEFEAALPGTERRNVRLGRRFVEDEGLKVSVRVGLTPTLVDEFLVVYDRQIEAMPRGKNYARRWRDRLLDAADEHVSVSVHDGTRMIVGSLWWIRPEQSVMQMRFSAASPDARASRVMRVAYLEALEFARKSGLRFASLGNDPSLFGHVVQPGLFTFKSRLGFTPLPSQILDPRLAGEYADRFLTLRSLSDPALVVTWGGHRGAPLSWPETAQAPGHDLLILSAAPDEALTARFRARGLREARSVTVST